MNPEVQETNEIIKSENPAVFEMLSTLGRTLYFPKREILTQGKEAKGTEINATVGIGLEDDGSPISLDSIRKLINIEPKDAFPYVDMFGKQELRDKWKKLIQEKNPSLKSQFSIPIVTNGITQGLYISSNLFINKGEIILSPDVYWSNYSAVFESMGGGEIETFNTFRDGGFDLDSMQKALAEKNPKILLLNMPNNPSGYTFTKVEAQKFVGIISEYTKTNKLVLLLDDAYFGLNYENEIIQESLFGLVANLSENLLTIKCDGATKEEYVWGFRVGFITFAGKGLDKSLTALEEKAAGAIRGEISNVSHLSQSLILEGLKSESHDSEKKEKYELLKSRYEEVKRIVSDDRFSDVFRPLPFNSGYFMCIELKEGYDADQIRIRLIEEYSTGVVSADRRIIRIAFSSVAEKKLTKLFDNIYECAKSFD
jgi:aspartate/methionine/tyrosine aminotransferase